MKSCYFFGAFLILLSGCDATQKRINSLNVLMPIISEPLDKRVVQYELQAYGGCWDWMSSQPQVLRVTGQPDETQPECQSKALVQLATNQLYTSIIWISLQDKNTQESIRVEAKVAHLVRLEIATRLRTIDVGAVEELTLRGFDSEDNTFSSLEGMRFEWRSEQPEILDFVYLKDTRIKSTSLRKSLEGPTFMTDIAVARGLKTGRATVVARVVEAGYEHIKEQRVQISVIEQFTMMPHQPVFLLPLQEVQFELFLIQNENLKKIVDVSANYKWSTASRASNITQKGLLTCGAEREITQSIQVSNKDSPDNSIQNQYTVVLPHRLEMHIRELLDNEKDFWDGEMHLNYFNSSSVKVEDVKALVIGKRYYVRISLFDEARNSILLTPTTQFELVVDALHVRIVQQKNYQFVIEAIEVSRQCELVGKFSKVMGKTSLWVPKVPIEGRLSVQIVTPLQIIKVRDSFLMPLVPGKPQKLRLYTVGGTQQPQWSVVDESVVGVTVEGQVVAKSVGRTYVMVKDALNPNNVDQVQIIVSAVTVSEAIEARKELVLGGVSWMYYRAYGQVDNKQHHFDNCSSLHFTLDGASEYVDAQPTKQDYGAMLDELATLRTRNVHFKTLLPVPLLALEKYSLQVKHQVATKDQLMGLMHHYLNSGVCGGLILTPVRRGQLTTRLLERSTGALSSNFQIQVFEPLTSTTQHPQPMVLAYASSFLWSLQGGPQPWEDQVAPQLVFQSLKNNVPLENLIQSTKVDAFKHAYVVKCVVPPEGDLSSLSVNLNVSSSNPASLLLPNPLKMRQHIEIICGVPSKLEIVSHSAWLLSPGTHPLSVVAYDSGNHVFYNYSSVQLVWSVTQAHKGVQLVPHHAGELLPHPDSRRSLQVDANVHCQVVVRCQTDRLVSGRQFAMVQGDATLNIQQGVRVSPSVLTLYQHGDNVRELQVSFGSGEYSVHSNDTQKKVIGLHYDDKTKKIFITPLAQGTVEVTVRDVKLPSAPPVTSKVVVSVPSKINLSCDHTLLLVQQSALVTLEVLDHSGLPYSGQYEHMKLDLIVEEANRLPKSLTIERLHNASNTFRVTGRSAAHLKLVGVLNDHLQLHSNLLYLEVFLPLRVSLSSVLLSPECATTMELHDGPSVVDGVTFQAQDYDATILDVVQLSTRIYKITALRRGNTKVRFTVVDGRNSLTEASTQVQVADVTSVQITSLKTVHVGATFRVIAQLYIAQQPLTFAVCPYLFKWTHTSSHALTLHTSERSAVNATAVSEGATEIEVQVTQSKSRVSVKTSHAIRCIQGIAVALATYIDAPPCLITNHVMLLPPNVEYTIRANKNNLKFQLLHDQGGLLVDSNGLVRSGAVRAQAYLLSLQSSSPQQQQQETSFLSVLVQPIQSIFIANSHTVTSLSSDSQVILDVRYLDAYGRLFAEGVTQPLTIRVLNTLVVEAHQHHAQLHLRSKSRGDSLIIVALEHQPDIYDVLWVQVGSLIVPASPVMVHVGGVVEFTAPGSKGGQWRSSKPQVMQVDSSGHAQALQDGQATITFEEDLGSKHSVSVTVFQATQISRSGGAHSKYHPNHITLRSMTNIRTSPHFEEEYQIDFVLQGGADQLTFQSDGPISNNLQFHCESQNPEVFKTRPAIITSQSQQQVARCYIQLRQVGTAKIPSQLILTTVVTSKNSRIDFKLSEKFTFPVQWGLRLDPTQKAIELDNFKREYDVVIPTSSRLEAIIDDRIKSHVRTSQEGDFFTVFFRVPEHHSQGELEGRIRLIDSVSQQEDTIFYHFDPSQGDDDQWGFGEFRAVDALVTGLAICVSMILFFNYFRKEGVQVTNSRPWQDQ